jgi:hypothetical protein
MKELLKDVEENPPSQDLSRLLIIRGKRVRIKQRSKKND